MKNIFTSLILISALLFPSLSAANAKVLKTNYAANDIPSPRALAFLNQLLVNSNNPFFNETTKEKVDMMNQMCSALDKGYSVEQLMQSIASFSTQFDNADETHAYLTFAVGASALHLCPQHKQQLLNFLDKN